jgi:hypothetical protein
MTRLSIVVGSAPDMRLTVLGRTVVAGGLSD